MFDLLFLTFGLLKCANIFQAMAEWANEEQLLGFGRQAEGCLGEEGVRRPKGDGRWVDALEISQRT